MHFHKRLRECIDEQFNGVWSRLSEASGVKNQTLQAIKEDQSQEQIQYIR